MVTITYETIDTGDPDYAFLGSGCDPEGEDVVTLRLVSIAPSVMSQRTMTAEAQNR